MKAGLGSLVLVVVGLSPAGCIGHSCTLMYAPSGVQVDLEAEEWPEGEYEITVLDHTCTVTLPSVDGPSCADGVLSVRLNATDDGLSSLYLLEITPSDFDVVITVDGDLFVDAPVTATFTEREPNGKGCGVARSGSATLTL